MKRLLILILIALPFLSNAQWQGASGVWQKNNVEGKWRYNAGVNGIYSPYDVFQQIQDGLISGGDATLGSGSVTIDTAVFRINKINYTSLPRTFTGIANSPSGTQYYLIVYGVIGGTLDTLSGARDTIAIVPNNPINTVKINTILVGDGGIVSAAPNLTGLAQLGSPNIFLDSNTFNQGVTIKGGLNITDILTAKTNYNTKQMLANPPINLITGYNSPAPFVETAVIQALNDVTNGGVNIALNPYGGGVAINKEVASYSLDVNGDINISSGSNFRIGGVIFSGGGGGTPDTTVYRTVANSYSLASGQPRLVSGTNIKTVNSTSLLGSGDIATELPLTFAYGLNRATNTISADTASATALVGKPRLTAALNLKANTASPTLTGTLTTPNINVTTSTLATSNYRLVTRDQTSGQLKEVDLGTINGALIYEGSGKTISVAPAADRTTAGEVLTALDYTITLSDFGSNGMLSVFVNTSGGDVDITLPSPTVMRNLEVTLFKTTSGNTMSILGSANINGSTPPLNYSGINKSVVIISNGTEYFIKSETP